MTVFGAIGTPLSRPLFMVGDSTNEIQFRRFIRRLKERVRTDLAGKKKMPILLLDNASAHKTHISTNLLDTKFSTLFQPPYSCKFNSIECESPVTHALTITLFCRGVGSS